MSGTGILDLEKLRKSYICCTSPNELKFMENYFASCFLNIINNVSFIIMLFGVILMPFLS